MLVGITGFKRSGKDTLAEELVRSHSYYRRGFADPLKEMALAIDPYVETESNQDSPSGRDYERLSDLVGAEGWEVAKTFPDVRRILQRLGKEAVRDHLGEDAWINALDRHTSGIDDVVIPDVRFLNEADYVRSRGGVIWRVERDGIGGDDTHASENELLQIVPDLRIHNTTLERIPTLVTDALERSRNIGAGNRSYSWAFA